MTGSDNPQQIKLWDFTFREGLREVLKYPVYVPIAIPTWIVMWGLVFLWKFLRLAPTAFLNFARENLVGILIFITGTLIIIGGFNFLYPDLEESEIIPQIIRDLYANGGAELLSIAVTVIIIDRLNERRSKQARKRQLGILVSSKNNAVAVGALDELRAEGWLEEVLQNVLRERRRGILPNLRNERLPRGTNWKNAYLRELQLPNKIMSYINLKGADLWRANLEGAYLYEANLEGADLYEANLEGADLTGANLEGADLRGTKLKHANIYEVHCDENTRLPDRTKWTEDIDWSKFGAVKIDDFGNVE